MKLFITLLACLSIISANAQPGNNATISPAREHLKLLQLAPYPAATTTKAKTTAVFDTTTWATMVDATWGNGVPTATKLNMFNTVWQEIDSAYAGFVQLPLYNWDTIVAHKRTEISNGVSRGRFAGIIGDLMTYVNDGHSNFYDATVSYQTPITLGLPLFRGQSGRFGACLTALDDSTAMVYNAVPNHPFGLQQGDIVMGYNGIPWKELVSIMLRHQLPNAVYKGSTATATWQRYIKAAGDNWYLFDTINIKKCNGTLVNFPTTLMVGTNYTSLCSDQMPVTGVPMLNYQDVMITRKAYSSGIVAGTRIGYVYMYDCADFSGDSLYNRVRPLVDDSLVTGLIIDIRTNFGGTFMSFYKTYQYLHQGNTTWIGYGERDDPHNRYSMSNTGSPSGYAITDIDPAFFNKPIAILTGPEAASAGDLIPVLFKHDSYVRTFGRSTAGAFGAYHAITLSQPYYASRQDANFFQASNPNYYLTHTEFPVDQPTWLKQDSVCMGIDNVVSEAINWITQTTGVAEVQTDKPAVAVYPVPTTGDFIVGITSRLTENANIIMTDITGNIVYETSALLSQGDNKLTVHLADRHLAAGCYLLRLECKSFGSVVNKVIVR